MGRKLCVPSVREGNGKEIMIFFRGKGKRKEIIR